jgi:tRNA-intron lyase
MQQSLGTTCCHISPVCSFTTTDGIKFGGDFLAYRGDPLNVHSDFVVCVLHQGQVLSDTVLSAAARVAVGAKKKLLLAQANDHRGETIVSYTTVIVAEGEATGS